MAAFVELGEEVAALLFGKIPVRQQHGDRPLTAQREQSGELPEVIGIEFNPVRCGFQGGEDVWLNDVLNVGVRPDRLVALARARFEAAGSLRRRMKTPEAAVP